MTFEKLLDRAIAQLQRRGPLNYGTLKQQVQQPTPPVPLLATPAVHPPKQPHREPHPLPLTPNGASSLCCFATSWTPRASPASSIRKATVRWQRPLPGRIGCWDERGPRSLGCGRPPCPHPAGGREAELALVRARWAQVQAGPGATYGHEPRAPVAAAGQAHRGR